MSATTTVQLPSTMVHGNHRDDHEQSRVAGQVNNMVGDAPIRDASAEVDAFLRRIDPNQEFFDREGGAERKVSTHENASQASIVALRALNSQGVTGEEAQEIATQVRHQAHAGAVFAADKSKEVDAGPEADEQHQGQGHAHGTKHGHAEAGGVEQDLTSREEQRAGNGISRESLLADAAREGLVQPLSDVEGLLREPQVAGQSLATIHSATQAYGTRERGADPTQADRAMAVGAVQALASLLGERRDVERMLIERHDVTRRPVSPQYLKDEDRRDEERRERAQAQAMLLEARMAELTQSMEQAAKAKEAQAA